MYGVHALQVLSYFMHKSSMMVRELYKTNIKQWVYDKKLNYKLNSIMAVRYYINSILAVIYLTKLHKIL